MTTRRKRRAANPAQKERSAATRSESLRLLAEYAARCLNDPAELEAFRASAASVGWKENPADTGPGYSLQNLALMCAQRRPLTHCGSFRYWLGQGRVPAVGSKSLMTWHHVGRKETDEEKKLAEDGWQSARPRHRYYIKGGTFDVSQTAPRETCPHCGTSRQGEDDRTTVCPPECAVFEPRVGVAPGREAVIALMTGLLAEQDEGGDE